jgi:protein phosphatase 2C family protein 2/3
MIFQFLARVCQLVLSFFPAAKNMQLEYAHSSDIGLRGSMEDEVAINIKMNHSCTFFGVFDGHGGDQCAKYISKELPNRIREAVDTNDETYQQIFVELDKEYLDGTLGSKDTSGTTATCCVITKYDKHTEVICLNTGDSRTILFDGKKTIALSEDHKPTTSKEKRRIKKAKGIVKGDRVLGLAVSRAFGDADVKVWEGTNLIDIPVTAYPDITRTTVATNKKRKYLVLACDGVWDVLTNEQVILSIQKRMNSGAKLQQAADLLVSDALQAGSDDNVSVVIVSFY